MARAEDIGAEQADPARLVDRRRKRGVGVRIFRADIDETLRRASGDRGDGHAFDQRERVAFHQHAVGEGAAVAFVGVADDVFLVRFDARHRAPFDAGRKARAAATAQAGGEDLLDDRARAQGDCALDDAAAREQQALLVLEIRQFLDRAERLGMRPAAQEARLEQRGDLAGADRAISEPPFNRLDFDERLKPEQPA